MSTFTKFDVHQEITSRIVAAIETAGEFRLPWIRNRGGSMQRPVNVASRKSYNGINIVSLWVSALTSDFASNLWGTYRQWQAAGAQVRKGEKASLVVFYKTIKVEALNDQTGETEDGERLIARGSWVFNQAQIDGFQIEESDIPSKPAFDPIERAEAFAAATCAIIREEGDMACFVPHLDIIQMPERRRFTGTETTSPAEGFYSTLCHELVHWSGVKGRLDRDMSGRFGSDSYAMEELVALS